jgi:hypothetical protein
MAIFLVVMVPPSEGKGDDEQDEKLARLLNATHTYYYL